MCPHQDVLLPLREIERRSGLKRRTIYRKMSEGTFPRPAAKVGSRGVRWLESDITAWIQSCLDAQAEKANHKKPRPKPKPKPKPKKRPAQ